MNIKPTFLYEQKYKNNRKVYKSGNYEYKTLKCSKCKEIYMPLKMELRGMRVYCKKCNQSIKMKLLKKKVLDWVEMNDIEYLLETNTWLELAERWNWI